MKIIGEWVFLSVLPYFAHATDVQVEDLEWTSVPRLGESSLELLRRAWIPKTTGNSQGHFTKPGIPLPLM
jgi:hypothetical protein